MKIQFPIREMRPDRTTYKQYGPVIASDHLFMELDVPNKFILSKEKDENVVLTPDGIAWVAAQLANAVDRQHESWMK